MLRRYVRSAACRSARPAEAMRPEPPATFRPGILERLGFRVLLTPASRMILRNLDRRRWRALVSILAIALAVAIVVSGRYSIDAVHRLVSVQFQTIQREDVGVVLQEPRRAGVRYDSHICRAFSQSSRIGKCRRGCASATDLVEYRCSGWCLVVICGGRWTASCARYNCRPTDLY